MELYDLIQIMNRRLGLLNKNCCQGKTSLSPIHQHILYTIQKMGNPSIQEASDTLGTDITTFSRQIQTLAKNGLVKKNPSFNDKRVYLLSLTEDGRIVLEETRMSMETYLEEILSSMNKNEQKNILDAFSLFNQKMAHSAACCQPLRMCCNSKNEPD